MKQILLDTNVLISFLTDRNLEQQEKAEELFDSALRGKSRLILHQIVVVEMVYVLKNLYQVGSGESAQILSDLIAMPGVKPVDEVSWTEVLAWWPARIRDFADGVLAAVAQQGGCDTVATFDQDFARCLKRNGITTSW